MRRSNTAPLRLGPRRGVALVALFLTATSLSPGVARADDPAKSVKAVERDLTTARGREQRLAAEAVAQVQAIEALRAQLAAAALAEQDNEDQLSQVETTLTALDEQELAKSAELEHRRADLAKLLSALTELARNPPESLMLMPTSPVDTVRTARLLGDVVPPIEARAKAVAHDLDELQALKTQVAGQRKKLVTATQRLSANHERLQKLVAQRAALYQQTEADRAQAAAAVETLGHQAANLHDLLHRLDEQRAAVAEAERHTKTASLDARVTEGLSAHLRKLGRTDGQMLMPARGRILLAYGQSIDGGPPQRGLTLETRPGAAVVAPFDGKIVFAGPFRGYGRILIIQHGEAYHTLIAGLGRIEVSVGQVVAMGEPIATASSPDAAGPADVTAPADIYSKGATGPVLYVELRRHGQPINPLPWLADRKVSG